MKIQDTMHQVQVTILHSLLFKESVSFAELQKASQLSSDHFNFHLKKLIEQEIVTKNELKEYTLTIAGKEFANRFDTDNRVLERQPKVAVLLIVQNSDGKFLYQQRLKQPYYGFWGRPTGKIKYGESIIEAAARELLEETNLVADLKFKGVYHKMDFEENTRKLLEDKIFFKIYGKNPAGNLLEEFEGGRNAWMSDDEVMNLDKAFEGLLKTSQDLKQGYSFNEKKHYYTSSEY